MLDVAGVFWCNASLPGSTTCTLSEYECEGDEEVEKDYHKDELPQIPPFLFFNVDICKTRWSRKDRRKGMIQGGRIQVIGNCL